MELFLIMIFLDGLTEESAGFRDAACPIFFIQAGQIHEIFDLFRRSPPYSKKAALLWTAGLFSESTNEFRKRGPFHRPSVMAPPVDDGWNPWGFDGVSAIRATTWTFHGTVYNPPTWNIYPSSVGNLWFNPYIDPYRFSYWAFWLYHFLNET